MTGTGPGHGELIGPGKAVGGSRQRSDMTGLD